ncbi:MAG: RimK/LysX family protein [Cyanobacteria bacterium J06632_22]
MPTTPAAELSTIGWREWLSLPSLKIERIKAKIDTGARSSALHAFNIETFIEDGVERVRFQVHPHQRSGATVITAEAKLLDRRYIRSSSGQVQLRPVIQTPVRLGPHQWMIELSLTNRDDMGFRLLLGRQAIRHRFLVDAGRSYLQTTKGSQPKSHNLTVSDIAPDLIQNPGDQRSTLQPDSEEVSFQ